MLSTPLIGSDTKCEKKNRTNKQSDSPLAGSKQSCKWEDYKLNTNCIHNQQ